MSKEKGGNDNSGSNVDDACTFYCFFLEISSKIILTSCYFAILHIYYTNQQNKTKKTKINTKKRFAYHNTNKQKHIMNPQMQPDNVLHLHHYLIISWLFCHDSVKKKIIQQPCNKKRIK